MAESYSVKATLSAQDKGFTSTMNGAAKTTQSLGNTIKSGLGFGVLTGVGMAAFNSLKSGAASLITEIDQSNAAWKTFEQNMSFLGKSTSEISSVKGELQKFAQQTVYSSSDMASTYAQLESVGVGAMKSLNDGTTGLVKGFGGLAAAAENPQQAMKTLSMQATQMAAKPTVAWEDFKLMLEQTPAGVAAVAKQMGMSTSELVTAVQEGEMSTEEFFAAIEKAGNSDAFQKMATEAKTVGQAMDGLKETLGNKLGPAFDVLSQRGIKAINGITDKLAGLDSAGFADKVTAALAKAQPYFDMFKKVLLAVGKVLKAVGKFLLEHADAISKMIPVILGAAAAYKAFKVAKSVAPGIMSVTKSITSLAGKVTGGLSGKLTETADGLSKTGKASKASNKSMIASAKAFALMGVGVLLIAAAFGILAYSAIQLADAGGAAIGVMFGLVVALAAVGVGMAFMLKTVSAVGKKAMPAATALLVLGAAVVLIAAGFALLAYSAIQLSSAGGLAIGVMAGLVIALGALMALAAYLGPMMTAGAIGFIAFGAAILLVGAGALLAAFALQVVAGVLPIVCEHGFRGAGAIALLGVAMLAFAVGAALAGVACLVLAAGITVLAVGVLLAAVAVAALGAAMLLLGVAVTLAAAGVMLFATAIPIIATYGMQAALAFAALGASLLVFAAGVTVAGAGCMVLGAGLMMVAAGLALVGAAVLIVAAGVLALSAAVLLLAAGALMLGASLMVCAAAFVLMAAALPAAATGAMALAMGMTLLLATSLMLMALLLTLTMAVTALGIAAAAGAIGIVAFGAGMLTACAGVLAMNAALKGVSKKMKTISSSAKSSVSSFKAMSSAAKATKAVISSLADTAETSMNQIISAMNNAASNAQSAGQRLGTGFTNGMRAGLALAPAVALMAVASISAAFSAGYSRAYSAGRYIGQGLVNGLRSMLSSVRSIATQIANEVNKAIAAKAELGSPSKLTKQYGRWYGEGLVIGINDMVSKAQKAAENLVSIPDMSGLSPAMAFGGELSADYDYYRNAEFVIDVPLTVDGKEFARATASYTEDELNKRQTRSNRLRGKV